MKLLVVSTWWPYPPDNGSRIRAYHLVRELSRRHRVTLLAFGRSTGPAEERSPLDALCDEVRLVARPVSPAGGLGLRGLLSRVPRHFVQTESPTMRALVSEACARHDLALALQIDAACYLADRADVPRVFDEVEITIPRDRMASAPTAGRRIRHGLTWLKHRHFVRSLVGGFDAATVVSAPEQQALAEIGVDPSRVSIVPNGVDVSGARERGDRQERIVYPGSVQYSANLDAVRYFVHDILPLVRRTHPRLQFWVTGDTTGVDIADLESAGATFTGFVPDIETLIAESAACVVPLRIGGGTRLKVLQAMALGTPVVSTSKGIEGLELLEADRHLLVADSPGAFAESVRRLMAEPSTGRALARGACTLVQARYGWGAIGERLERVIDDARARFHARTIALRGPVPAVGSTRAVR